MFPVHRVVLAALSIFAFAAAPGASAAKPISGKLSEPGYTVIALGSRRRWQTPCWPKRRHLQGAACRESTFPSSPCSSRAPDGVYAGPVVVATGAEVAGVRSSASGREQSSARIKIHVAKGYRQGQGRACRRTRSPPSASRGRREACRSALGASGVSQSRGGSVSGDRDVDGIPDLIDIDDDGDLILDRSDVKNGKKKKKKNKKKRKARAAYVWPSGTFLLFSDLDAAFFQTANANAPGLLPQRDRGGSAEPRNSCPWGSTLPTARPSLTAPSRRSRGRSDPRGARLLLHGGDGEVFRFLGASPSRAAAIPTETASARWLGRRTCPPERTPCSFLTARTAPRSAQATSSCSASAVVVATSFATLQYMYVTTPALVSYTDTAGNCAKVAGTPGPCVTEFSYPVASGAPGNRETASRSRHPLGQDVIVDAHLLAPAAEAESWSIKSHRRPPTAWTDIGGQESGASVAGQDPGSNTCEQERLLERGPESDAGLSDRTARRWRASGTPLPTSRRIPPTHSATP